MSVFQMPFGGSQAIQCAAHRTEGAFVFALSVPRREFVLQVVVFRTLICGHFDVIFHAGFVTGADHVVVDFGEIALNVFAADFALVQHFFGDQIGGNGFEFLICMVVV